MSHNNEELENVQEDETKNYDNFSMNFKIEEDNLNMYRRNTINQSTNKDSSSIFHFCIITSIYFLIIFGFYIYLYFAYTNFMKKILKDSKFIFHLQRLQNNAIDLFNGYREFIFDENSAIYGNNVELYLQNKLDELFGTKGIDTFYVNSIYNEVINIKNMDIDFLDGNLCKRIDDSYFKSEDECLNFLEGQIQYGYEISYSFLIDFVGNGIYLIKYYFDEVINFVFNLTKYGYEEYRKLDAENEKFRLYLFNNDTVHSNINILFAHVLLPYYLDIVNYTSTDIINSIINSNTFYLVYMICYISLNAILFLIVWIPFINNMNSLIYNAKKILGIIPIHILSTLSNIKKILNIEKNKNN